jgi:hypothetical protein
LLAGREVELAVVTEVQRSPVVLVAGVERVLVEHDLAAGDRPGVRGVRGEPRQPVAVRRGRRVEQVIEVVGDEIGVEDDVEEPLLYAERPHVGELQERRGIGLV